MKKSQPNPKEIISNTQATDELWQKMNVDQRIYFESMEKYMVTMVDEKAGTGKTTVAVAKALDMLRKGAIHKIIYVRFIDDRAMGLGFEPGTLTMKEGGFMLPFYEAMAECGIPEAAVSFLIDKGVIETGTDVHMRGRNLHGFLIIDEAQNAKTTSDLKLYLTRLHDDKGRGVVIGHSGQEDGKLMKYGKERLNAFQVYQRHFAKYPWSTQCNLPKNYRGKISQAADAVEDTLKELE